MSIENEYKEPLEKTTVRCLLLFNAVNYRNASTLCVDTEVPCSNCSINLALKADPKLTFYGLQKAVANLENKN